MSDLLSSEEITIPNLIADLGFFRARQSLLALQVEVLVSGLSRLAGPSRERGLRRYTVSQGESLQTIAIKLFRQERAWPQIANANRLQFPYTLVPGQELIIPDGIQSL